MTDERQEAMRPLIKLYIWLHILRKERDLSTTASRLGSQIQSNSPILQIKRQTYAVAGTPPDRTAIQRGSQSEDPGQPMFHLSWADLKPTLQPQKLRLSVLLIKQQHL